MTGLSNPALFRRCAQLDQADPGDPASAAAFTLRLLARRILELTGEINELNTRIAAGVDARAPQLLRRYGVGPDTAAALLLAAGDNPERLNSEASFAALCGVSPIEASSGKTQRRRLNRGGDRQANSALYTITIARLRWDKRTQTTSGDASPRARPAARPSAASSATSPARSTKTSPGPQARHRSSDRLLDIHRGIKHARNYRAGVVIACIALFWAR
jgi:transposase